MSERVGVNIPSKAEHLLVARLAASGVCSRLGMGIEQMEDVKSAVAEACLILIHDRAGYARLNITFEYADRLSVEVRGEEPGGQNVGDEIDAELSLALLEALSDETQVEETCVRFTIGGGTSR